MGIRVCCSCVVVQDNASCSPTPMAVTYQVCNHIALNTKKGNFHKSGLVRLNRAGCSGYVKGYCTEAGLQLNS